MRSFLRAAWLRFCNLVRFSPPTHTSLRDKAIAVAGRVTTVKNRESSKVSCPVCLNVLQTTGDTDLRMTLAVHLSLWHPDDVKLQWNIMNNKKEKESIIHLPSVIIGVGVAAGFGALLALSAKNRTGQLPIKMRRICLEMKREASYFMTNIPLRANLHVHCCLMPCYHLSLKEKI